MGRMSALAKKKAKNTGLPSTSAKATINRAGGVSFEIEDAATKLITMCGGSFFMEPRYYNAQACVPARLSDGKLGKLEQRLKIAKDKALAGGGAPRLANSEELDDVSHEVLAAAWDVLNGDNPRDLVAIAHWLRREMNIRLTPQVLIVLASQHPVGKKFVKDYVPKIVARPDEVKTIILMHRYFFGMKSLKRCLTAGLAEAMSKMGERGLIKYEGQEWPSWKDVLFMVDRRKNYPLPKPVAEYFMFGRVDQNGGTPIAKARKEMTRCTAFDDKAKALAKESLANWEVVLSQFGTVTKAESKRENWDDSTVAEVTKGRKKEVWEYLIANDLVGYMALMRNLRNLLEADVSLATVKEACAKLSDPDEVKRSRQLPFRFAMAKEILEPGKIHRGYAYRNTSVERRASGSQKSINAFLDAIETAADIAVENVPELPGLTAIFTDNSGSMESQVSERSKVTCLMAANILAGIVAKRSQDAVVCAFGTDVAEISWTKRTRVLEFYEKLAVADTKGMSTNTHLCIKHLQRCKARADRIIILSDMQCWNSCYGVSNFVDEWHVYHRSNPDCWLHSVNLHGYGDSMVEESGDHVNLIGAFSEKMVNMLLVAEGAAQDALPTIEQVRERW